MAEARIRNLDTSSSSRMFQVIPWISGYALSLKGPTRKVDGWIPNSNPGLCFCYCVGKHHNHVNQKSALISGSRDYGLTFGSRDYGAYLTGTSRPCI